LDSLKLLQKQLMELANEYDIPLTISLDLPQAAAKVAIKSESVGKKPIPA